MNRPKQPCLQMWQVQCWCNSCTDYHWNLGQSKMCLQCRNILIRLLVSPADFWEVLTGNLREATNGIYQSQASVSIFLPLGATYFLHFLFQELWFPIAQLVRLRRYLLKKGNCGTFSFSIIYKKELTGLFGHDCFEKEVPLISRREYQRRDFEILMSTRPAWTD